eukprot:GDKJ01023041.1.p1 GENE.GDKJ01023041.1~~GDKJ01023041.1.p1  ORF type:complete len:233 (-),score=36.06 GDKJ01023041.1:54-752(-)
MSAKLPNLDHFTFKDYKNIYEPAEDTYLFIDAILDDKSFLTHLKPHIVLEIGPGSGVITTYFAKQQLESQYPSFHIAVDINAEAAKATKKTASKNQVGNYVDVIIGDLCTIFRDSSNKSKIFDVAMFNPPYVPSEAEEVGTFSIDAAWAGGENGRVVTDEFLRQLPRVLSANGGILYLLLEKRNLPDELTEEMKNGMFANINWKFMGVVRSKRARNEYLHIYKFSNDSEKNV